MPEDDIRAKYDTWHDQVHESGSDKPVLDAPWHARAHEHLLAHVPGKAVLEIGCGRGAMSQYLLTLGPSSLYAADFSPSAVEQTKSVLSGSSATVEVEDIQALSHASSTFDTVISFETIEHVPDPALAVRELARVLKPSGTLILTTPNYLGLYGLYRGYRRLTGRPFQEAGQPLNNFVMLPRTLRWVKNAGLQVTEWDSEGQYSFWPGKNPVRRPFGDKFGPLSRITGLHSFVAATKPAVR